MTDEHEDPYIPPTLVERGYKEILTMVRIEGCAVGYIFDRRHPKTLLPKFSKSRSSGFRGDADSRDFYY